MIPIPLTARDVATRIKNSRPLPDIGVILTDTVVLEDLDAPPPPRTTTPGKRVRFLWQGPPMIPMFLLKNVRAPLWRGVDIHIERPCDVVFLAERTISTEDAKQRGISVFPSTAHRYDDVRIFGNGLALRGVFFNPYIDENNEHGRFDNMMCYGVARPWVSEGQNAKHHLFTGCCAETYTVAVSSDSAFNWRGGTIAVGNCAFETTRCGDSVKIESVGVEATKRLLMTAGPTTDAQSITLDAVDYRADQLHDDQAAILQRHAGVVSIIGGSFGDGKQRIPQIHLAGSGEQALYFSGQDFGAFGAGDEPLVVVYKGVRPLISYGASAYANASSLPDRTRVGTLPTVKFLGDPLIENLISGSTSYR